MYIDPEDQRAYQQRQFFQSDKQTDNSFNIFLAVLAAILVAWLIREAYYEWQARRALDYFNEQIVMLNRQTQAEVEKAQAQQNAFFKKAETERLEREAQRLQAQQQQKDLLQAQRMQQIAALEQQKMKEQAWRNYYKPVIDCNADNPNKQVVLCGNDYVKARKKFDDDWARRHP